MAITIFDHLKALTDKDKQFLGNEGWSNWMINRYLSMKEEYVEMVNIVQKNTWQMEPKYLFGIYKSLLPQYNQWIKYIKNSKKIEVDPMLIELLADNLEFSKRDVLEYIETMSEDDIKEFMEEVGYNPKPPKPKKVKPTPKKKK